jgi:serine/threonine protein kinase
MPDERWQRVKDLIDAALERPAEARETFLQDACGGDDGLRREVESLLRARQEAGEFLSRPAASFPEASEVEGRRIGPYRILSRRGHGGMGVVYQAVRDDDVFRKTVAFKVVHGGASPEHLRRLGRERQILARLQHPNIATILDGGTTDEGQPYLVMEYVEGQPIDAYCNAHGLVTRQRLEMFRIVCGAVHYAHQNLVVHRDLKPQNILVPADGQPKLLDFGIAKLLAAGVDPEDAPTATRLPLMTPEYASPEQVRGQPVTTSSDVYSLGVVLYELLTGSRPYAVPSDSLEGIVRVVCDTEPGLPSATGTSASELRGDLDTILLKALRKDPSRRYLSAQEMADDIRRHLVGLPVLARPDTYAYRFSRFVGRHRAGVSAAALAVTGLLIGTIVAIQLARVARVERTRAEQRFAEVRQLASSFLFEFHDAIKDLPGSTAARQLVVERAAQHLDRLRQDARGDVGLQRELAAAYQRLGEAQGGAGESSLGNTKVALVSYEKALVIRRALVASLTAPADVEGLALLEMKLSRIVASSGDLARAAEMARSAAARLELLATNGHTDLRGQLASVYQTLGYDEARLGDEAAALKSLRKAVDLSEAESATHPTDATARSRLARIQCDLVERLQRRGDYREAAALGQSAQAILEGLVAAEPNNARYRRDLIHALNVGSEAVEAAGDVASANRGRRRSLELAAVLLAIEPGNQHDRIDLTYALHYLGAGLVRSGQIDEGLERLRQARRSAEVTVRADSGNAFGQNRLAEIDAELAFALAKLRIRPAEMCASLHESATIWGRLDHEGRLPGEDRPYLDRTRTLLSACPPGTS